MAVDAAVALGVGTALALGAALVVLGPLWNGAGDAAPSGSAPHSADADRPGVTRAEGVSAVEALREIEFDRATGKLSDDDYAALKATYTRDALAEMRAAELPAADQSALEPSPVAAASMTDDPVEAALRAYRARQGGTRTCPEHGARSESDALFCSDCGRFLAARCSHCGAACDEPGQRFCTNCGAHLAPAASATPDAAGSAV